jgi:osmoprotectant transport system ATP-binding protein
MGADAVNGPERGRTAEAVALDRVSYAPPGAGRETVREVSFTIDAAEIVVLVGRSGAGKTTILKLVNRLLEPTAGEVRVAGRATTAWDPVELRRHVGWVIQEIGLFPHMTVARNVGLVPELLGWERPRVEARARELLALVGLAPDAFAARRPHELSGGQRQRVGVARALAADPPVLLLDEPFGALDPITRRELQLECRALLARLGKAALFVTHDLREAFALGGRVGLMAEGRLVLLAPPAEFLSSDHPEARALTATLDTPVG